MEEAVFQIPVSRAWQSNLQLCLGCEGAGRHLTEFAKIHNHFWTENTIMNLTRLIAFLDQLQVFIYMFWCIVKKKHLLFLPVKYSWVSSNNSEHSEIHFLCMGVEGAFCMNLKGVCVLLGTKFYKYVLIFIYIHGTDTKKNKKSITSRKFPHKIKERKKKKAFRDRRKCPANLLLCAPDYVDFGNSLFCEWTNYLHYKRRKCMCVRESCRLSVKENVEVYTAFNSLLQNYPQEEMTAHFQLRKRDTAFKCHYRYWFNCCMYMRKKEQASTDTAMKTLLGKATSLSFKKNKKKRKNVFPWLGVLFQGSGHQT